MRRILTKFLLITLLGVFGMAAVGMEGLAGPKSDLRGLGPTSIWPFEEGTLSAIAKSG